eukprot:jgi/Botrbrau1/17566/Bobra.0166s0014.1
MRSCRSQICKYAFLQLANMQGWVPAAPEYALMRTCSSRICNDAFLQQNCSFLPTLQDPCTRPVARPKHACGPAITPHAYIEAAFTTTLPLEKFHCRSSSSTSNEVTFQSEICHDQDLPDSTARDLRKNTTQTRPRWRSQFCSRTSTRGAPAAIAAKNE